MNSQLDKATVLGDLAEIKSITETLLTRINAMKDLLLVSNPLTLKTHAEKVRYVMDGSCRFWGISAKDLTKQHRQADLVARRKVVTKVLKDHANCSFPEIAKLLGYKNHATALWHYKNINENLSSDMYGYEDVKRVYNQLLKSLAL